MGATLAALLPLTFFLLPTARAGWVSSTSTGTQFSLSSNFTVGTIYRLGMVTTPGITPIQSGPATTWSSVNDGNNHGCALQSDSTLWCWGIPLNGELGIAAASDYPYAKKQPSTTGTLWSQVSSGYGITCGVKTDRTLWCWGTNSVYQLGLGADNTTKNTPANTSALTTWASVSVGPTHACALKTDGTLWCWGDNSFGQLGTNDSTSGFQRTTPTQVANPTGANWTDLSSRGYHTCAQDSTSAVYCWGRDSFGQLGNGGSTNTKVPAAVPVVGGIPWRLVRTGITSTCGIRTDGKMYCWGQNTNGQLGVGDNTDRFSPALVLGGYSNWSSVALNTGIGSAAGQGDTCAIQSDGTLWCWGLNDQYQLGLGDTATRTSPAKVGTDTNWSQVSPGVTHACGVKTTGTLWCWGNGLNNQLGVTVSAPNQVGLVATWQALAPGRANLCLIRSDGTLWCSDYNQLGQLGQGDTASRVTATQVGTATNWRSIGVGGYHVCGTKTDGTLWCWGDNANGELGQGDTVQRSNPTQVGAATDWAQVSTGLNYNCATRTTGTLYCWGLNSNGQLGNGNNTSQSSPVLVSGGATNWSDVSSVYMTSCAVRTDGTLYCWGDNARGEIGNGTSTAQNVPALVSGGATTWSDVETGRYHTCALRSDKSLYCWGSSNNGQLGQGDTAQQLDPVKVGASTWRDLTVGAAHTCGIQTDSTLWCWGFNGTSQLGLGDIVDRWSPTQVAGVHSRNVTAGWYMTYFTQ